MGMPMYYRNKIYTEEEREKLWIQKLDKNERWVLKQRIDVSNGYNVYYKVLEEARAKNARLGYGGEIDWDKKKLSMMAMDEAAEIMKKEKSDLK